MESIHYLAHNSRAPSLTGSLPIGCIVDAMMVRGEIVDGSRLSACSFKDYKRSFPAWSSLLLSQGGLIVRPSMKRSESQWSELTQLLWKIRVDPGSQALSLLLLVVHVVVDDRGKLSQSDQLCYSYDILSCSMVGREVLTSSLMMSSIAPWTHALWFV